MYLSKNNGKRKKVAIYTMQGLNFGNRLQNYAIQEVLVNLGYQPYSLKGYERYPFWEMFKRKVRCLLKEDRKSRFYKFNSKIYFSRDYISKDRISPGIEDRYYAFIAGSDQIWNPDFPKYYSINCYLPFKHARKISYAASFGRDFFELNEEEKTCISDFKALSVREETGKEIIEAAINREVEVSLDPTLLLTTDEWRAVEKRPKKVTEGYILVYFLSPMCEKAQECLEDISQGKRVIYIMNGKTERSEEYGPLEFIWLFDHADAVLTDSFHASVFSFIFNKPFLVFDRNWDKSFMNSRINTLLKKLGIERKYVESNRKNDFWEHDYSYGYDILKTERQKSIDYLKKALEE